MAGKNALFLTRKRIGKNLKLRCRSWDGIKPGKVADFLGGNIGIDTVKALREAEKNNLEFFDQIFLSNDALSDRPISTLSPLASRSALFIMLYRGYPILQTPFQLLTQLLEIDEQLSTWRYRHMSMVHRMIGSRIGTGGSSGKDYLKAALDKHYIFKDIAQLTSFLIERRRLPQLSREMEKRLGFAH